MIMHASEGFVQATVDKHNVTPEAHQALFNALAAALGQHFSDGGNPHHVTAAQLGLGNVLKYCGSVSRVDELPTGANLGDVWNVRDTGHNYAWDGTSWDQLAGVVDLSNYLTTTQIAELLMEKASAAALANLRQKLADVPAFDPETANTEELFEQVKTITDVLMGVGK